MVCVKLVKNYTRLCSASTRRSQDSVWASAVLTLFSAAAPPVGDTRPLSGIHARPRTAAPAFWHQMILARGMSGVCCRNVHALPAVELPDSKRYRAGDTFQVNAVGAGERDDGSVQFLLRCTHGPAEARVFCCFTQFIPTM